MKLLSLPIAVAAICLSQAAAQDSQHQGSFERTLQVAGLADLDVLTDSGGITVTPGAAGTVRIRATLKAHRGQWFSGDIEGRIRDIERNPPVEQNGNRIRIGHFSNPLAARGISIRFEIIAPPETKLKANADSGGIRVSGISGPVDVHTDSGGIEIRGIRSNVSASADSGGVKIYDVLGPVHAQADSGGIDVIGVEGEVDVSTDSGGIRIEQTRAAPVRAHADSGGAHLRLASTGGYNVTASSDSGRVTVPEMIVSGEISRRRAQGKIRGGGPTVDVRVDSGNVVIQ